MTLGTLDFFCLGLVIVWIYFSLSCTTWQCSFARTVELRYFNIFFLPVLYSFPSSCNNFSIWGVICLWTFQQCAIIYYCNTESNLSAFRVHLIYTAKLKLRSVLRFSKIFLILDSCYMIYIFNFVTYYYCLKIIFDLQ